jgi:hypothetical protein
MQSILQIFSHVCDGSHREFELDSDVVRMFGTVDTPGKTCLSDVHAVYHGNIVSKAG